MNWNDDLDVLVHIEDDIQIGAFKMAKNPKLKPLKMWIVKCRDGHTNDTWEVRAATRQDAKDWAVIHGAYSTFYLTAKLKK